MGKIIKRFYCSTIGDDYVYLYEEGGLLSVIVVEDNRFYETRLDKEQAEELVKELQEHLEGM